MPPFGAHRLGAAAHAGCPAPASGYPHLDNKGPAAQNLFGDETFAKNSLYKVTSCPRALRFRAARHLRHSRSDTHGLAEVHVVHQACRHGLLSAGFRAPCTTFRTQHPLAYAWWAARWFTWRDSLAAVAPWQLVTASLQRHYTVWELLDGLRAAVPRANAAQRPLLVRCCPRYMCTHDAVHAALHRLPLTHLGGDADGDVPKLGGNGLLPVRVQVPGAQSTALLATLSHPLHMCPDTQADAM